MHQRTGLGSHAGVLTADHGYGPGHAGMSVAQVEQALSVETVAADDSSPANVCWHIKPAQAHEGVELMILEGRFMRASLWGEPSRIRTERGIGVGDSEDQVRRVYGALGCPAPRLWRSGSPLSHLRDQRRDPRLRFETDIQGRVQRSTPGTARSSISKAVSEGGGRARSAGPY